MSGAMTRRDFIQAAAATGAVLASGGAALADDNKGPLTVGVVGAAHIHTGSYLGRFAKDDIVVKSLWDHNAARAKNWAGQVKAAVVDSPQAIFSDPAIKAVAILSETDRHFDLVMAAAKAKKHLFVEKPLGFRGKEAQQMARAVQEAGVVYNTGYFMRSDPKMVFLKEQVEKGNFGKITRIRLVNCHNGSLGGWFDTDWRWMADPKQAGGGGFLDLGSHVLDIMLWLMGDAKSATADIQVVTGRYGNCDETGEGMIQFGNGAIGTISAGWVDLANPATLLISGTEGNAAILRDELYFVSKKVDGADGREPWKQFPAGRPSPIDAWISAVNGAKDQSLVPVTDAAHVVTVMEAMYTGAAGRKWVEVK